MAVGGINAGHGAHGDGSAVPGPGGASRSPRGALLYTLGRLGGPRARRIGARLDVAAWAGPAYAVQRLREERAFAIDRAPRAYDAIWRSAAAAVGATVEDLHDGMLEIRRDGRRTRMIVTLTDIDGLLTVHLALDKRLVHRLLTDVRVPVPEHVEIDVADIAAGERFLAAVGGSVVVKPADGGSSGAGITSGVRTPSDLRRACVRAGRNTSRVLIERQVTGDEYRLLLLDGEPIGAVRRRAPVLTGDGRSTVAQLVAARNRRRIAADGTAGVLLLTLDLDAVLGLERAGLRLDSVPPAGAVVALKGMASEAGPDETETVPVEAFADELIAQCRAAADAVGLRLAGIDLITPDIGRSLTDAGGAVIEINGTPGLHYHYQVADPATVVPVAVPVLEALLARD